MTYASNKYFLEVYGDIETGSHTEIDLLHPSNPYSATKVAAQKHNP